MATVWPIQELGTFWERTVIPIVYFTLLSLLPIPYQHRKPRWMPARLYDRFRERFAAACGQCVIFDRDAYVRIGGHEAVKREIVEDVALARRIRSIDLPLRMSSGHGSVACRMYRDEREMFAGFRKNFLAGFDHHVPGFILLGLLHLLVYIGPVLSLAWAAWTSDAALAAGSALPLLILWLHRRDLDRWMGWKPNGFAAHHLGVLWFQRLAAACLSDHVRRAPVTWKGRDVRR